MLGCNNLCLLGCTFLVGETPDIIATGKSEVAVLFLTNLRCHNRMHSY